MEYFSKNQSLSHATMRRQDLIPCFLDALNDTPHGEAYMVAMFPPVPAYVMDEGDDSDWWDSEDAAYLLEGLIDALNEYAPDGYYFGSHPGDGSDYGFWECGEG